MEILFHIVYTMCWLVLILYVVATLIAFVRQNTLACAGAFLCACLLCLDLSLLNAWSFLPAFRYHIQDVHIHGKSFIAAVETVLYSEAACDIFLVILGSFGSWLAMYNAANMLRNEVSADTSSHKHERLAQRFIKAMLRTCDYIGFGDKNVTTLPAPSGFADDGKTTPVDTHSTSNIDDEKTALMGQDWERLQSRSPRQTVLETTSTKPAGIKLPGWHGHLAVHDVQRSDSSSFAEWSYHTELGLYL
ncbi:hypothetical protein F4808DRAFT_108290 [Astrocystis sublimbata]|nr:hypothetical protein F4808DRAFT_108290 [Astrocystis sublimbata]